MVGAGVGRSGGAATLLIHGVTSSAATWWRIGPALAATGRRVVAVDQAGHGRTGHWQGHHRFRDNAADVAAFIRAAGLGRDDLQVVGHFVGGDDGRGPARRRPSSRDDRAGRSAGRVPCVHGGASGRIGRAGLRGHGRGDRGGPCRQPGLGRRRRPRQGRGADPAGRGRGAIRVPRQRRLGRRARRSRGPGRCRHPGLARSRASPRPAGTSRTRSCPRSRRGSARTTSRRSPARPIRRSGPTRWKRPRPCSARSTPIDRRRTVGR